MNHKIKVHGLFSQMADEVFSFIKESESEFTKNWVPATYIKEQLGLNMSAYPQGNKIDNKTGWLFATIARFLQDQNRIDFKKVGNRSYYKSRK